MDKLIVARFADGGLPLPEALFQVLRTVQAALACHRDGLPILFEGQPITLEELKYLVVDPAVEWSEQQTR